MRRPPSSSDATLKRTSPLEASTKAVAVPGRRLASLIAPPLLSTCPHCARWHRGALVVTRALVPMLVRALSPAGAAPPAAPARPPARGTAQHDIDPRPFR